MMNTLKHISIMLWNQRRKYTAVIFEQMLVFIAVALSLTIVVDTVHSYNTPGRLETDNVVSFGYMIEGNYEWEKSKASIQAMDAVKEYLGQKPYVIGISESYFFIPYIRPSEYYWADSLVFAAGKKVFAHFKGTDEAAEKVFGPDIVQGRWFHDGERIDGKYPAVVSELLVKNLGLEDPVGKTINFGVIPCVITGVVSGIKETPLKEAPPSIIVPIDLLLPTGSCGVFEELAAKVKSGYEDEFANDFYREFHKVWSETADVECFIIPLSKGEGESTETSIVQIASTGIPALFLLIFSILGTIGVNLIDVKERLREFALRISCGASRRQVIVMFLLQNVMVTGLSAFPGIVIVLSIYPLEISLPAAATVLLLALTVSFLCAGYPAFRISRMNPAELLRSE